MKPGSDPWIRTHQTCFENAIADKTGSGFGPNPRIKRMQREWVRIRILESGSVNFYPDPSFLKAGSDPRIRTHQTCFENAIADKTGSGFGPNPRIKRMQREWVRIRILESGSVNFYPDPGFVKAGSDPWIRTHQTCFENTIAIHTLIFVFLKCNYHH